MAELGLEDVDAYRARLLGDPQEWAALDACCRISISRFCRDRGVFERLRGEVLPDLARSASERAAPAIRVWSAGCGSGEEPFSVALAWRLEVGPSFPGLALAIVATDASGPLLERARCASFRGSSLRELPPEWCRRAFERRDEHYSLRPEFRADVELRCQDIRTAWPDGPFDLVLCRNLVFTYFDEARQRQVLEVLLERLRPDGVLVVGAHESLPDASGLLLWPGTRCVYQKTAGRASPRASGPEPTSA
jgi:chemotaxis protein methyltransferase CheR